MSNIICSCGRRDHLSCALCLRKVLESRLLWVFDGLVSCCSSRGQGSCGDAFILSLVDILEIARLAARKVHLRVNLHLINLILAGIGPLLLLACHVVSELLA